MLFCTCHPVSFCFWTYSEVVFSPIDFVIKVQINFEILILEFSCLVAHLCLHFCPLFGNSCLAPVICHSLASLTMALWSNCISTDYVDLGYSHLQHAWVIACMQYYFSIYWLFKSITFVFGYSALNIPMGIKLRLLLVSNICIFQFFD